MMGLGRKTVSGFMTNALAVVIRLGIQFLIVLPILARTLTPEAFGVMAMAMTFVALLGTLNDFGISTALVRVEQAPERLWSSAFWTNAMLGLVMSLIAFATAPTLAGFYNVPLIAPLGQAVSLVLFLHALCIVPTAWLQRTFQFRLVATIDVVAVVGSSVIAVAMVTSGYGVWSLVGQQIGLAGLKLGGIALFSGVPLRFAWNWADLRPHLLFSVRLTATSVITYVHRNGDNILIGRFLGAEPLGVYTRAYQLMMLPQQLLSQAAGFALLPAMSRMAGDLDRLAKVYLSVNSIYALAVFPLMTGLAALSAPFVRVLLGEGWMQTAPLLSFLALVGIVQTMNGTANVVWTSLGHSEVLLRWALIRVPVFIVGFAIGVWAGSTILVAALYLTANLVLWLPASAEVLRRLALPKGAFLRCILPPAVASGVMAGVLVGIQYLGRGSINQEDFWVNFGALLGLSILGAIIYTVVLLTGFRSHIRACSAELQKLRRLAPASDQ